ncbi:hypothetical protein KCU77_g4655, partial [Aureobasidium melanogenum]
MELISDRTMTRVPKIPFWTELPAGAELIDLDNETDHYVFNNSNQEETKIKVESTPESSTVTGLGNSILQRKQNESLFEPVDEEALNAQQQALIAQFNASRDNHDDEHVPSELGEDLNALIEQEHQFFQDKDEFEKKQRAGQVTQEEEHAFLKQVSAYNKRKRELKDLLSDNEDPLFEPPSKRPKKKSRAKASSTSMRSTIPNLRAHHDFWENADAAEQMNTEPTYEEIERGGRGAAFKDLRSRVGKEAARLDIDRMDQASKSFTNKKGVAKNFKGIKAVRGGWLLKGMKTPLKNYQLINCGWMRRRETGTSDPKGGILADQMGLGKTVTCLANIVNGRPLKSFPPYLQPASHTTLIIVPSNLLSQWRTEIKRHTAQEMRRKDWGLGRVHIFRDSQSKEHDPLDFTSADIVLTTYHDVRRSWPDCEVPEGLSMVDREAFWKKNIEHKRGPLHTHRFLRIILDEGHQIANPETLTAQACFNLVGDYKFVLTGTPMINGSKDLYSLLAFIDHPTVRHMKFESFKSRFCNVKNPMSLDSLSQEMVESVACFTHKDKLFDARLITLPKPHNKSLKLNPTKLELEIYNVVRARFKARAQTLNENGEPRSNKFHIWAMHTLLRQLTAHPLLVPTKVCDYLELEDFEKLEKAADRQSASGETAISAIHAFRKIMRTRRTRTEARAANGITHDIRGSSATIDEFDEGIDEMEELVVPEVIKKNKNKNGIGLGHGKKVDYRGYVDSFKRSANPHIFDERALCCKCNRPAREPVMSPCYHIYCHTHLEDMMTDQLLSHPVCLKPGCGKTIDKNSPIDPEDPLKPKWLGVDKNVLPSTKTLAVKSQILNWLDPKSGGDPDAKCIVFCQWKSFLGMLTRICEVEGWKYVTLHGSMSKKTKDSNIEKFKTTPDIKILIATLKTGGQGLNLSCARYVLNVDPYWNTAAEIQAFSRVYRIGQEHETEFVNLTLAGTVDEHMNAIKERKKKEIDQVNASHKKLSMDDLLRTFEPPEGDTSEDTE